MKIVPLGKQVLIRVVIVDVNEQGIHVPQTSMEGKEYRVEATGAECTKGLKAGDRVLFTGMKNSTYADVPGHAGFMVTNEDYVLLKFVEEDSDDPLNAALKPNIDEWRCNGPTKTAPTGFIKDGVEARKPDRSEE